MELVRDDLRSGILPARKEIVEQNLIAKRIDEAKKFSFDEVITFVYNAKEYNKPRPNQKNSGETLLRFWNNQFRPYVEKIGKLDDIREINIDDIENFLNGKCSDRIDDQGKLIKGWSGITSNVRLGWIGIIFSALKKKRLISVNPCTGIERKSNIRISAGKKVIRFEVFSRNETKILFEHLEQVDPALLAVSQILFYAFIRESELLRLKLWMIDFDNNRIIIPPDISKNGRKVKVTEYVKIPEKLKVTLKMHMEICFGGDLNQDYYLFPRQSSFKAEKSVTHLSSNFAKVLSQLQKKHSGMFTGKTLYALKHTGNTIFLQDNLFSKKKTSLQILMYLKKQNRHSDLSMTQRYISDELGIELDKEDNGFIYS